MDLQLEGKRALITGSTAGIGFSIAEALAKEGATVIVNGRSKQRADDAVNRLKRGNCGGKVEGLAADLAKAEGAREAIERYPEVEILVNNLGIFEPKAFEQIPDEDWFRFFETNVLSGVRLSRHYLPRMKQRNWGRIVFISSESALQIPPWSNRFGRSRHVPVANGGRKKDRPLHARTRVLPFCAPDFAAAALRNHRGDRICGCFRVQPAIVGHQWRSLTGGRWPGEGDCVRHSRFGPGSAVECVILSAAVARRTSQDASDLNAAS